MKCVLESALLKDDVKFYVRRSQASFKTFVIFNFIFNILHFHEFNINLIQ